MGVTEKRVWRQIIFAAAALLVATSAHAVDVATKRGYVNARFGQMHYRSAQPAAGRGHLTPIVFFHQNPKSGDDFKMLVEAMGRDRLAIAFDTPGYGESYRPPRPPAMADLAGAMADALDGLGFGQGGAGKIDVFGFHTGVLIATELAVTRPDLVRRVILASVPYMKPDEVATRTAAIKRDFRLPEDGSHVMDRWRVVVINRAPGVSVERAAESFLADIRSLDKFWYASHAMFSYPVADRIRQIGQPVLLLAPHEGLLEHTRAAHRDLLPRATLVELPDVKDDVFDTGAAQFASALRAWLDWPGK
ncbi:MAG: alpha/beta fold hydrolase [Alphaproteobacteria bacterium]|nr:alpha/beta fold hydrolase [Alphaproteobacteria bacterium]